MKRCTKCTEVHPMTSFPLCSKKRDGRGSWCSDCINKHKRKVYADNIEISRERGKNHQRKNKDKYKIAQKAYRDSNPDRQKGKTLQKYWPHLSWQECIIEFEKLKTAQNNLCAICGKPETCLSKKGAPKLVRDLCVDHCHETLKVRGLLCDSCNVLIARAKDNAKICISAANYLIRTAA